MERGIHVTLSAYKQIYDEKDNKPSISPTDVNCSENSNTFPRRTSVGSFSRAVVQKKALIVITGDDSSILVIVPEDLPAGQDADVEDSVTDDLNSV
jgi:hypothetical protein